MTEKEMTKKELKESLETIMVQLENAEKQLAAVSEGYQQAVLANNALSGLVMKYEETINILTTRLIEARPQS